MENGSHLFVVKNYSAHKENDLDERFESEEFVVGGHVWMICFYPNGNKTADAHNSDFSSVYAMLMSRTTSDHVPFLFEMCVLDQSGNGNHIGYSTFQDFPSAGIAWVQPNFMYGCTEFIEREIIESPHYLKDDCLKIRVMLGVLSSQIQYLPPMTVPSSDVGPYFVDLLEREEGVDIFFNVENQRFCAHKWILDARCPALLSSLSDFYQYEEIDIQDIEPKIFKAMLLFVYTGLFPQEEHEDDYESNQFLPASFMGKMLAAADRYEFKILKQECELHISGRISGKSVAYILHLAELYHAEELKVACVRFLNEVGLDLTDSAGVKYLKEMCPLLYLELGYEENYAINGHQERRFFSKILSVVKETFVGILEPHEATDEEHKMKEL